jgi:hypothetical protein
MNIATDCCIDRRPCPTCQRADDFVYITNRLACQYLNEVGASPREALDAIGALMAGLRGAIEAATGVEVLEIAGPVLGPRGWQGNAA